MRRGGGAPCLALLLLLATLLAADRLFPPDLSRLDLVGTRVLDRGGATLAMLPAPGGVWRLRTTVADVSPVYLDLLIRTEDRRFRHHYGVDFGAILRAAGQCLRARRIVSGGSTLTMQAARLLEPRPRTLRSKVIEALRAWQLERRYTKDQILDIWLTLAPFGGNLEGVTAGSQAWFGIPPAGLDRAQAALLVALPRRPEALRPDRHPQAALTLRNRLLRADPATGPDELAEALPTRRIPFPRHAEPALRRLVAATHLHPAILATTIDLNLQVALEQLVRARLVGLPPRASIAALVADAGSRQIRAIVSGDGSRDRAGALDLTLGWRSPGSAMKPFLYGLAFQDGLLGPDTLVDDLPRHFGGYAPEDFDRDFAGQVTAREALQRSLNLPAVTLLDRIGPVRFAAWLDAAGLRLRMPPGAGPSLPLALGGAAVQLRSLTGLYAALATDGSSVTLSVLPGPPAPVRPLLQPSAAALVATVLTRPFPDGGPDGVAWKTGTSWGGRDAWAMGFDAAHVAGVWVGRPDGTALPGATGLGLALPVLAGVFALLPAAPRDEPTEAVAPLPVTPVDAQPTMQLLFPPPGAALSAGGPVPMRVMGGRRPITFLVDGVAVPSAPASRATTWLPPGPGFYTLAAQDSEGVTVRVRVRVQ